MTSVMVAGDDALTSGPLDAALDRVICIDDHGRVTYFNESAQRTFGYLSTEALGRELADVIVPPSLRAAHRRGIERFTPAGESSPRTSPGAHGDAGGRHRVSSRADGDTAPSAQRVGIHRLRARHHRPPTVCASRRSCERPAGGSS
jgi:PAS domain S-box-containing protein